MDRDALRIANLLVGNDDGDAGMEAALIGPAIAFDQPTLIAIAGGDLEASVNGAPAPLWHPMMIPRGGTLRCGRARFGCRAYVAVAGGVDVPEVFGSRSTYLRAEFGGYEGRALRSGDVLQTGQPSALSAKMAAALPEYGAVAPWSIGGTLRPQYSDDVIVRLMPGAHTSELNEPSLDGRSPAHGAAQAGRSRAISTHLRPGRPAGIPRPRTRACAGALRHRPATMRT
jgi:antagonist of KipI